MQIRLATREDVAAITLIYNHEIRGGTATFDTEEKKLPEMVQWFEEHFLDGIFYYPILVATSEASEVVGFAALNRYSPRRAYQATAEVMMYVRAENQKQGIGTHLLSRLLESARATGIHNTLARITQGNDVSVKLHLGVGFEVVGVMKEVGRKFDRLLDVTLLQKIL